MTFIMTLLVISFGIFKLFTKQIPPKSIRLCKKMLNIICAQYYLLPRYPFSLFIYLFFLRNEKFYPTTKHEWGECL